MSDLLLLILAGVFLPLFPLSMVFNALVDRVQSAWLKSLLFLIWPQCGLLIMFGSDVSIPDWLVVIALITSALYALRMLSLREVNQWNGFLATSLWSLLWLSLIFETSEQMMFGYALGMTVPLILLITLSAGLERRFGAAYTGLYGGLARTIPRFSGVLVTVVIAAIATPLFPTFFILFEMIVEASSRMPMSVLVLLLVWLLWSWAGTRLIQGMIVGRANKQSIEDLQTLPIFIYAVMLIGLVAAGVYMSGVIL